ncbi:MAG: glycogen-binding domain-containing protein [Spirochaetes bacterium]|nr:glycogen-binding domain-containing protein [Spirochaetota bacterium]
MKIILLIISALVLTFCASEREKADSYKKELVVLKYKVSDPQPKAVFLVGSFNDWVLKDPRFKMKWDSFENLFFIRIKLKKGRYEYKFIVDGNYICDPKAKLKVSDPLGGKKGVFWVR